MDLALMESIRSLRLGLRLLDASPVSLPKLFEQGSGKSHSSTLCFLNVSATIRPLRVALSIVAAVDAPATRLSRFLASGLYPLLRQAIPAHLDSTSSFLQAIASVELSSNSEFASLDIVSLYGSIPLEDGMFPGALSIVTQFFDAHRSGTLLAPVTKEDFAALLRLSLTSDTIQVNSTRFKQVSGMQMGNNLSTSVAIIFMSYIEKQIIEELSGRIKLWLRYIEDVFVIFEDISAGAPQNV